MVESIQQAVVSYYGQFENSVEEPAAESAAEPAVLETSRRTSWMRGCANSRKRKTNLLR